MDDELTKEVYLGDGAYARFDGHSFVLRAPRENGDHVVYLEAGPLEAFEALVARVRAALADRRDMEDTQRRILIGS